MSFQRGRDPKEAMGIGLPVLIRRKGGNISYRSLKDFSISVESVEVTTISSQKREYIQGKSYWIATFDMDMCPEPIEVEFVHNRKRLKGKGILFGDTIEGIGDLEEF